MAEVLMKLAKSIAKQKIKIIDLTQTLRPSTPVIQLPPPFAPSNPFEISEISHYDDRGPAWYWNNIACGEHTGTHFDAPIHWVTGKDYRERRDRHRRRAALRGARRSSSTARRKPPRTSTSCSRRSTSWPGRRSMARSRRARGC